MKYLSAAKALAVAAVMLTACDDETGRFGIPSDDDLIATSSQDFTFTSRTLEVDSVVANSAKCYLGEVYDPETEMHVRAEFVAQLHSFENYTLPADSLLVKTDGQLQADSVDLNLYYSTYYGSGDNPMKIAVYELDRENVLREDTTYYSDIDLDHYLPDNAQPLVTQVFTPEDYTLSDAVRTASSHYKNVHLRLPNHFGTRILRLVNEHPEYFATPWQFNHYVCAGFCFKLLSGLGTMLSLDVSALNIYFRYRDAVKDSTYVGISRFSATAEVIQSTRIINERFSDYSLEQLPYTFVTSPAGLVTELALPVDQIFDGHPNDTISRARVVLKRYNGDQQSKFDLPSPTTLLMVKKPEIYSFFEKHKVSDNETSYTSTFESSYNTYTFTNIALLLSNLYHEKLSGMQSEGLTSEQWNERHPDWNRVVLIPVVLTTTTNQTTGLTTPTAITNEFSLTSARLYGGTEPLQMQVIYSRYK